jgi:hypothetical protein
LSYTQGLLGVPGFTHNTNVIRVFQHAPESASNEAMVIDQQYRNLMHSVFSDVPFCSERRSSLSWPVNRAASDSFCQLPQKDRCA